MCPNQNKTFSTQLSDKGVRITNHVGVTTRLADLFQLLIGFVVISIKSPAKETKLCTETLHERRRERAAHINKDTQTCKFVERDKLFRILVVRKSLIILAIIHVPSLNHFFSSILYQHKKYIIFDAKPHKQIEKSSIDLSRMVESNQQIAKTGT